jgi:hypothetical protein
VATTTQRMFHRTRKDKSESLSDLFEHVFPRADLRRRRPTSWQPNFCDECTYRRSAATRLVHYTSDNNKSSAFQPRRSAATTEQKTRLSLRAPGIFLLPRSFVRSFVARAPDGIHFIRQGALGPRGSVAQHWPVLTARQTTECEVAAIATLAFRTRTAGSI